ncbi:MAG: GNAT family N-acetyltransferase, partial [Defluviitaleaceae bacterium]|nr:GNAT family N-acetyltransferase [Defluviitaleaceae bacterium]
TNAAPERVPMLLAPQIFLLCAPRPVAMGMLAGAGETARLNLIYVPPEFRGKGYGKQIVAALAAKARENAQIPVLYTACENFAANKLYLSLGFKEAGRLTEVRF